MTNDSTTTGCDYSTQGLVDKVLIYPNPASNQLFVLGISNPIKTSSEIINLQGKIFQSGILSGNPIGITLLSEGFYFIRIHDNSEQVIKKVLIVR